MDFDQAATRRLFEMIADRIIAESDELTDLDQAIGDGDHGINMKRGFGAVRESLDEIAGKPLPDAMKAVGMSLVMKVGGASGPLYGTLFMALGKELGKTADFGGMGAALAAANGAVMARGKSEPGQKTMLDVLVPVAEAMTGGAAPDAVRETAAASAEATIPMKALRGRASFLGERSIGHMDPGARSSQLLIEALCDFYEEQP